MIKGLVFDESVFVSGLRKKCKNVIFLVGNQKIGWTFQGFLLVFLLGIF